MCYRKIETLVPEDLDITVKIIKEFNSIPYYSQPGTDDNYSVVRELRDLIR